MIGKEAQEAPIPKIKLSVPPVHPHHLKRERVEQFLTDAMDIPGSVILASAPPGYGKSSLLAGWLRSESADRAWLTLDSEDDDPGRFTSYLFHALAPHLSPEGARPLTALSGGYHPGGAETLAVSLSNLLAERARPLLLVLDDYHLIESAGVHEILEELLRLQPPQFHIAILTREDPPLPLARLRAQGRLTEIRMEELSFTGEETEALLKKGTEYAMDPRHVAMLQQKTEGWAAAIQLAIVSLARRREAEARSFIEHFSGNDRHIIDYLMDEVLRSQPAEVIEFLDETSQLDRFNSEVCDWIRKESNSEELLRQLEGDNLLILSLDGRRNWFRYHNLFADYLRTRLPRQRRREINERAASWFESEEMEEEALRHALRSARPERFLPLLLREAERLLWAGRPGELLQLSEGFSRELMAESSLLFELIAWAYFLHRRPGELESHLQRRGGRNSPGDVGAPEGIEILRSLIGGGGDQPLSPSPGEDEEGLPPVIPVLRATGRSILLRLSERPQESLIAAQGALNRCRSVSPAFLPGCVAYNYGAALLLNGDASGAVAYLGRELERLVAADRGEKESLTPLLNLPLAAATVVLKRSTGITPKDILEALTLYEKIDGSHLLLVHGAVLAEPFLRFHGRERDARGALLRSIRSVEAYPLLLTHQKELHQLLEEPEARPLSEPLSEREREVLRELARGLSNAEIAETLYISTGTVKWHINRILAKLDAQSRTQAAARARELGLV